MSSGKSRAKRTRKSVTGAHLSAAVLLCIGFTVKTVEAESDAAPENAENAFSQQIAQFADADRKSAPAPCQVLFVGSSSIVKWKDMLAADMAPIPVIDRGFGGSQIEDVNRWFDRIVAPYRPRAIVFYAGENDIDVGKSVARVVADFDEFMSRKTKGLGDTPVYFISLKPSKMRFGEFGRQTQVNDAIRMRSKQRTDLRYIDVVTPMLQNGQREDIYESDNLHMTREGYLIWTRAVRSVLLPDAKAETARCRRNNPG